MLSSHQAGISMSMRLLEYADPQPGTWLASSTGHSRIHVMVVGGSVSMLVAVSDAVD